MASNAKHDWPMVRLGDVCEVVSGGTPKTSVAEYWDGEIPWVTPADLSKLKGLEVSSGARAITQKGVDRSSAVLLPAGSVVLSSRAPIGYVAIAQVPMATNQGCKSFIPSPDIDARYLAHYLLSQKDVLQSLGTGATFKELSKSRAADIRVPLPPLDEQRRIAAILDEVQRLTELQESCLTAFDQLIDSLTEAIAELKSESLGKLGVSFVSGKSLTGNARNAHPVNKILKVSAVSSGTFLAEEAKPLPADYSPPTSHLVALGDVLFCRANGSRELIGVTAKVDQELSNYYLPDKLWKLQVEGDQVLPMFVYRMLRSSRARQYFMSNASGAAGVKNISKRKVLDLRIPIPSLDLQHDFIELVQQVEKKRAVESVRLEKIAELRNSLVSRGFRDNFGT